MPEPRFLGCRAHGMSEHDVEHWWRRADEREPDGPFRSIAVCTCCSGPCPAGAPGSLCRRCGS